MLKLRRSPRGSRRGAIAVLVAVSLIVVLAFVSIAIEGGGILEKRRHAQATADAAALAGAEDLFRNYPRNRGVDVTDTAEARARTIAAANGFSGNGTNSTVTVRTSPELFVGGPRMGQPIPPGTVEVSVQYNQPRYFSQLIGSGPIGVPARAVARGRWVPSYVGIHVLDLHAPGALTGTGESFATVRGASVIVNSDAPDAATTNGSVITADNFKITGGTSVVGGKGAFIGDIEYNTPPEPDPLRHIPEPTTAGLTVQRNNTLHLSNGSRSLSPGVYRGGIKVAGQGNLTMAPGIYYMDGGGFEFSGQGSLMAPGVMIFNAPQSSSDVVNISGTGSIYMAPPASGTYKGLTLFQDRESLNEMSVSGGGEMLITGTFYTAYGTLKVSGGGDSQVGSQYISRLLSIVGNGGLFIDYAPEQAIPRRVLHLVE
jgi:Flp pilus assembly protein TadG